MDGRELHGKHRRRVHSRGALGSGAEEKGCGCVCSARTMCNRVCAGLCYATGESPRWSSGGGTPVEVFRLQGWATAYRN